MRSDLRQIRYFVATAEELHFRRAAERLGIAQPALSRAIQSLEAELDVRLFNRTNRSVQITPAGQVYLEGCREVLAVSERTLAEARWAHEGTLGTLRIGYTDFAIAGALPKLLLGFQSVQPNITLKPQVGVTRTQMELLSDGKLDIGFVTAPIAKPGFASRVVQSEAFLCICAESHPLARRDSLQLADLAHEDFVHGSERDWHHFYAYLMPLCQKAGFEPQIVQEGNNTAAIMGLVACGMGLTVLTESVCSTLGEGLVALPFTDVPDRVLTAALWRPDVLSAPARFFVDYIHTLPEVAVAA